MASHSDDRAYIPASTSDDREGPVSPSKEKDHAEGTEAALPSLNVFQLVGITYFSAAGGPFGFEEAIGSGGGSAALLGLVFLPFFWSIPLALMTAEFATMMPEAGGHIIWVDKALGPYFGTLNAAFSAFTNAFDNALYPVMFVDYLEEALFAYMKKDFSDAWDVGLRVAVIVLCVILNIKGADLVGDASMLFGVLVLSPFIVMTFMGLGPALDDLDGLPGAVVDTEKNDYRWGAFAAVMLWNTSGFDNAGTCAAEVANPGKTYPRALAISVVLVMASYALPTLVGIYYIPDMDEWEDGVFVDVGEEVAGPWLRNWLGLAGVVSSLGLMCTLLCTASRMLEGMAHTGALPPIFGKLHPKYGTPWVSIVITGVTTLALSVLPFSALAEADMLFYNLSNILKFVALVKFRVTHPEMARPYKVPLNTLGMALYFSLPCLLCGASIFLFSWSSIIAGVAVTMLVSLIYWLKGGNDVGLKKKEHGSEISLVDHSS
uniref:Amino acid permease/ SLC12A domain-containing protein n=1 Tax=Pyramimonas obovata TaxID=1411642 RepID=A0A7S0RHE9_9CHLO|mmetsp:Transcript_34001/g.74403  ORF Transcript_34001/g.74403 Transcript_34001/m.74403 type:complete len:489 (+) Transcript_34001:367-1833(+)|eukprot:CAMPEP_0118930162 /NCGR_PEP_ID=MMETSP1169-20130426/6942_1 /TAXON_ID=36882 /ORGANISM="Pyramimonas obovata, Strain CCMP722" /LENGTH=488 /DNA_ID=CAMNT_0006872479 /DNA_START=362 /DNA_END=1828 /DNA_ORIENTATION=-